MMSCTPAPVVMNYVEVPLLLVERNRVIAMAADVFFKNSIAFLMTLSRNIRFVTAKHSQVRMAKALVNHME